MTPRISARKGWLIACVLAFLHLPMLAYGHGDHEHHAEMEFSNAWARTSPPGAPGAGYLTIHNHGEMDDTLLSVDGEFAARSELHLSTMEDGVMKMIHQANGVRVPAGGMLEMKPGSYHLMFTGLEKPFEAGEEYSIVLTFEHAGEFSLSLPVMQMAPGDDMSHEHDH